MRNKPSLDQLDEQIQATYNHVRKHIIGAIARDCRDLLATLHPESTWVKVMFKASDQVDVRLFIDVALDNGSIGDEMEFADMLFGYLDLFELFFKPGEYVRVTRDKIYVKKGWKRR